MDWIIFFTLWGILGILGIAFAVNVWPAEKCSYAFRLFWMVICGPVSWGVMLVCFLAEVYVAIKKARS